MTYANGNVSIGEVMKNSKNGKWTTYRGNTIRNEYFRYNKMDMEDETTVIEREAWFIDNDSVK